MKAIQKDYTHTIKNNFLDKIGTQKKFYFHASSEQKSLLPQLFMMEFV